MPGFRRNGAVEREFWRRTLGRGEARNGDPEIALAATARDALELFKESRRKLTLKDAVEFAISRAH